eukprot:gene15333-18172_t
MIVKVQLPPFGIRLVKQIFYDEQLNGHHQITQGTSCPNGPHLVLSDQVERCRVLSLSILTDHTSLSTYPLCLPLLIQALEQRLPVEEVEELRLSIISLVSSIIDSTPADTTAQYTEKYINLFKLALKDKNHQQVEQSSKAIIQLSQKMPTRMAYYAGGITASLVASLADRHQRIRSISLEALSALVLAGATRIIETLQGGPMSLLAVDHSPKVRMTLCESIGEWYTHVPTMLNSGASPITLITLLSIATTDIPDVRLSAKNAISKAATAYYSAKSTSSTSDTPDTQVVVPTTATSQLPANCKWWDQSLELDASSRRYVVKHAKRLLQHHYATYHDNELDPVSRETKVAMLYCMVMYLGDKSSAFIEGIIEMLVVSESDMVPTIRDKIAEIASLVGHFVAIDLTLTNLTESIKREVSAPSGPGIIQSLLNITQCAINGHSSTTSQPPTPATFSNFLHALLQIAYTESRQLAPFTLQTLHATSKRFPDLIKSNHMLFLRLLLLLDLCSKTLGNETSLNYNVIDLISKCWSLH